MNWRLLCIAPNPMEAAMIQGRLESAGIPVLLSGESMAELYGLTFGDLAKVKVFVPEPHVTEAEELLNVEASAADPLFDASRLDPDPDEESDRDDT